MDDRKPSTSEQPWREGFDPKQAATWTHSEHAVYDTGYEEGGSGELADWVFALDEIADLTMYKIPTSPSAVAEYIVKLRKVVDAARGITDPNWMEADTLKKAEERLRQAMRELDGE